MDTEPARTTHSAALLLDYGDRLIVGTVRDMHRAIARQVFLPGRVLGLSAPETVHNTIASAVYGAISGTLRLSSAGARKLAARGVGAPLEQGPRGRRVIAAVNGLVGDRLRMDDDPQAITMTIRVDGKDVAPERFPIQQAFRGSGGHLVVFLHGLCESDESWQIRARKVGSTYPERIARETDGTPVLIRYNTGLHVSENGAHLAALLTQLMAAWPVPVTRITLIGHSMGGLVARAATNHATSLNQMWPHLVKNVICLGTPHTGALLEKVVHLGSRAMRTWPQSSPLSGILDARSVGILDLRHGYISRDEWSGQDLTAQWGLDRIAAAPLPRAEYHFIAATLGPSRHNPFGDLLVDYKSATGAHRSGSIVEGAELRYVPSVDHFALLNHSNVGDSIVGWLNARGGNVAALTTGPQVCL
ncbi:hypothetical protein BH09ACT10_BH09ACT10_11930 [soil metagenome]